METNAATEAMTWAMSVIHAAVLNDEAATVELVSHRMVEALTSEDSMKKIWEMLAALTEVGVVYVMLLSDTSGVPPQELISTIGGYAAMWESRDK